MFQKKIKGLSGNQLKKMVKYGGSQHFGYLGRTLAGIKRCASGKFKCPNNFKGISFEIYSKEIWQVGDVKREYFLKYIQRILEKSGKKLKYNIKKYNKIKWNNLDVERVLRTDMLEYPARSHAYYYILYYIILLYIFYIIF